MKLEIIFYRFHSCLMLMKSNIQRSIYTSNRMLWVSLKWFKTLNIIYNEIEIFYWKREEKGCVCAEIVWRISLRNLDQTLISPSSKIGLSWNLVSMFYSCSSWIWAVGLSIGIPYGEFCSSEQGWAENKGENSSIAQVSSKRDISLICGPIGLRFCQNVLHSSFYNLIG